MGGYSSCVSTEAEDDAMISDAVAQEQHEEHDAARVFYLLSYCLFACALFQNKQIAPAAIRCGSCAISENVFVG